MKKKLIKMISFVLIFMILLEYFTVRYMPEYFTDQTWSTTATYKGFYAMEKDSIDVVFLGSSAGSCGFIPQELYDNYGLSSYNLSCEQQNMISSYYWLKETLRYQCPSVVVLESKFLFYKDEEKLTDARFRKAFDHMKLSPIKIEAISTICNVINGQAAGNPDVSKTSEISWYFPIIRFHSRWEETNKAEGFEYYLKMSSHHELKGFTPVMGKNAIDYKPLTIDDSIGEATPSEIEKEYLDKIVALCSENNLTLILVMNPSSDDTTQKYNYLSNYADSNNLAFLNFNTESMIEKLNYNFNEDNESITHANLCGAQKITNYIGQYIVDNSLVTNNRTEGQFEVTDDYYRTLIAEYYLLNENDFDSYLKKLLNNKSKYYICIAIKDEGTNNLKDSSIELLRELGLDANLNNQYRCSYIAFVDENDIYEAVGYSKLNHEATIDRNCNYYISSGGFEYGNACSIKINGIELAKNRRGINIVVWDIARESIVDSVVFDTFVKENTASR